jgi:hypothetical protein
MFTYVDLLAELRQPMRDWWRGTGSWLMFAMALCWSVGTVLCSTRLFDPREVSDTHPAAALGMTLAGFAAAIGVPLIWLLAARAAVRVVHPASASAVDDVGRVSRRLLFLYCLQQGLQPLLLAVLLRQIHWLAVDLSTGTDGTFLTSMAKAAMRSLYILQESLAIMLLAVGILVVTGRMAMAMALVLSQFIGWVSLFVGQMDEGQFPPWEPEHWWLWELQFLTCAALIYGLIYGLLTRQRRLWLGAFALLAGTLLLSPVLEEIYSRNSGDALWLALQFTDAVTFLLWGNYQIGDWLQSLVQTRLPVTDTVLGHLAPGVPLLWPVFMLGSLFGLLYWLLGEPWRKPRPAG